LKIRGIMRVTLDLANRWKEDSDRALQGILVHDLNLDSPRIGISFGGLPVSTHWKDREKEDPIEDAEEWIESYGAEVLGHISLPDSYGKGEFFYLIIDQASLAKVVEGLAGA